jgi:hypothetical protein
LAPRKIQSSIKALLMFPFSFRRHPSVIELHILAGQSNAQGYQGDATMYPRDPYGLDRRILFWYESPDFGSSGGAWVQMGSQKGRFPNGYFGPEVTFSRALARNGKHPAIFKFSQHSTSLAKDWRHGGQGGLYDAMCSSLKTALAGLKTKHPKSQIELGSFIWIQGESDAADDASANAYEASLREMLTHLRTKVLHEPYLPIILGVDEQHPWVAERPQVVEAQKSIAAGDARIVFTSMKGIEKFDTSHLTPAGLVMHGSRLFEAREALVNEAAHQTQSS